MLTHIYIQIVVDVMVVLGRKATAVHNDAVVQGIAFGGDKLGNLCGCWWRGQTGQSLRLLVVVVVQA
jgi:hypothetical protein